MEGLDPTLERKINDIYRRLKAQEIIVTQRKWSAYMSANQLNIANSTATNVHLDTVTYDCDGVGFSSYGYEVQERGLYLVIGNVVWFGTLVDGARYDGHIVNGLSSQVMNFKIASAGGAAYMSCNPIAIFEADPGDVIYLTAYHADGSNNPDLFGTVSYGTFMHIHLLSRQCK